jgi:RNA polymerase primary sigma factor
VPEKEAPETAPDSPLLDLSDAAVKKLTHSAKKRGYVTHDQINSVLPSEEVNSQEIEDVLADETAVIEPDERRQRNGKDESTEPEMQNEGGEIAELKRPAPAKGKSSELSARTDDPVRMYLREMGSVELLSREGEIAIAKRIEAGREAMIAGMCESPLTFQAIIIWRDELNEGKVFLRDIIDLEATYAGPDGQPIGVAPAGATPFKGAPERANGEEGEGGETPPGEGDFDDDDMENSLSLAAIEAELKPKVVETFDNIATPTSGCAACRIRTSRTSCATIHSRPRRSAATRSSRTTSSAR